MKNKAKIYTYLKIAIILLIIISIPRGFSEKIKGLAVATFSPLWEQSHSMKSSLNPSSIAKETHQEIERLKLENQLLANEVDRLTSILSNEAFLAAQKKQFLKNHSKEELKKLALVHHNDIKKLVQGQFQAIPAQVIFRSLSLWNNSLWINVGKKTNKDLNRIVVEKNSPVMAGAALLGVVDYVGENQSRIRLITDPRLSLSVRAIRNIDGKIWYLAKGELRGSRQADHRRQTGILKGVGFNYDFADSEGPSRDLRTGVPYGSAESTALPIIETDDLLITTGMDGIFPPGMLVAHVINLTPLKEGDYTYEIEAMAEATTINDLSYVYVLPPLGFDFSE